MTSNADKKRLLSLDVFRGITIAGMVLVNNPGDWGAIYEPLSHAEWNGLTPTDLIFPFFLFIVGIAIPLALGKRIEDGGATKAVYLKILRRAAVIFALGLFLNAFPYFEFSTLRIPGVLQRIAICYLVVSVVFLNTSWKTQAFLGVFLLLIYWFLMAVVPVPCDAYLPVVDNLIPDPKACNLSAYLDRAILGVNHIWSLGKVYDPEGILSTIPAISTTISGVLTGLWLKTDRTDSEKLNGILFFGLILAATGWIWNFFFPFNKALWTSSYVLISSGLALCFFGFCYYLIDILEYKKWTKPFAIFGVNALALYVLAELSARLLDVIQWTGADGTVVSLKGFIYGAVFAPLSTPKNSSLMFALTYILFWLFVMWLLYRRRIFIKV